MSELTIILEPAENGWWAAHIAEVPGAISQGKSPEEARSMVLLALEDLMEAYRQDGLANVSSEARIEKLELKIA